MGPDADVRRTSPGRCAARACCSTPTTRRRTTRCPTTSPRSRGRRPTCPDPGRTARSTRRSRRTGPDQAPGQAVGIGLRLSRRTVPTLPRQLTDAGLHVARLHAADAQALPAPAARREPTRPSTPTPGHNYAVRHNPFMYFRSIIGNAALLPTPRASAGGAAEATSSTRSTTPQPELHHARPVSRRARRPLCERSEGRTRPGRPFLKKWAPRILALAGVQEERHADHHGRRVRQPGRRLRRVLRRAPRPNTLLGTGPGIVGPGGGKIGALVISRWTRPDTWSTTPYNHYSLLASLEEIFGLPKLGMATGARARRLRSRRLQHTVRGTR